MVQAASFLAWRGFESFEPDTNFLRWLLRILANVFLSRYRKERRQGTTVSLDDVPELYLWGKRVDSGREDVLDDPAGTLLARLDAERINSAIATLPEEYRVVAALYFAEDLSYREIGDMAAIPIGTVRSRLFRARRRLQVVLWEAALELGLVTEPERSP